MVCSVSTHKTRYFAFSTLSNLCMHGPSNSNPLSFSLPPWCVVHLFLYHLFFLSFQREREKITQKESHASSLIWILWWPFSSLFFLYYLNPPDPSALPYGKMRLKQICSCKKLEKHHYNWNCSYWPFLNHGYMIWFCLLLYHLLMCFVHAFCCMKVLHHGFLIEHPLYVSFFGVERF